MLQDIFVSETPELLRKAEQACTSFRCLFIFLQRLEICPRFVDSFVDSLCDDEDDKDNRGDEEEWNQ